MRLLFGMVFALLLAAAIGLTATWLALTEGTAYGGVTIGASRPVRVAIPTGVS